MSGAAFGLLDLDHERPRTWCEDCGTRLLWDAAALDVLVRFDLQTRRVLAQVWREGGSVYACPSCGLGGAFSALIWGSC